LHLLLPCKATSLCGTGRLLYDHPFLAVYVTPHAQRQAFEWVVRDVHKLRDFVENPVSDSADTREAAEGQTLATHDDFEVLREFPTLGEGKFKLEIGARKTTASSIFLVS
jgi:hypothetical protein